MPFETFTGKRVVTKEPRISIIKQGHFSFNTGAMQVLKNKAATHLQLLFDRDTNRIAFKPCAKDAEGAYMLRETKGVGAVSGIPFLKFCGLATPKETRSYPVMWDENNGMLLLQL